MSEIGYVIRKRYIRGKHEGKSYILIKSGFVRDDNPKSIQLTLKQDMYTTLKAAKIAKANYMRNYKTAEIEYEIVEVR